MTREEHEQILTSIRGTVENPQLVELTLTLQSDYDAVLGKLDETTKNLEKAQTERNQYALLNNKLLLGNVATTNLPSNETVPNNPIEEHAPKRKFSDLNFD